MFPNHILLIEDSPSDAELISRQLKKAGCETVKIVESKEDTLSELEKKYDLIISDYKLIRFNAIDVLKWARIIDPHIAFIICSGAVGDEKAAEVIKIGADDFISKDNLRNRLLISVQKAFEASKLKKAEAEARKALFNASERLEIIVNNIQESTILVSTISGLEYELNQANAQFTRLAKKFNPTINEPCDFENQNLHGVFEQILKVPKSFIDNINFGLNKTFQNKTETSFQEKIHLGDNQRMIFSVACVPIFNQNEEVTQALILIKDITTQAETDEYILTSTLAAQEKERKRLSYELHDSIGQSLSAAVLTLNQVLNSESDIRPTLVEKLNLALAFTNNAIQEARSIAHNLLPKSIEEYGLEAAIDYMINSLTEVSKTSFSFQSNLGGRRLNLDKEMNIFRICQEAVNNIIKHSQATKSSIQIMNYKEVLILTIDDNGVGFDSNIPNSSSGIGLGGIYSRVKAMDAEIEISSSKNKGTNILIEIPLTPN